jgi:diguanylate cyclase
MAGGDAADMASARDASRALFEAIGALLIEHQLFPTPDNYAFAYDVLANPDSARAKAVARLSDGRVRLSQEDVEALGGGSGDPESARRLAAAQSLVARTEAQVEGFETMVRSMRSETGHFGDDLAAGADAIRRTRDAVRIDEAADLAGAMVNRVRTAERRLEAATTEASELRQKLREARDNARRDPLTGLPNRRALEESYAAFCATGESMCLAVCDIDRFKSFNDNFGHLIGDRVLKAIAEVLADCCAGQLVARYGGEEFAVLFSGVALDGALDTLEAARSTVAGKRYRLRETAAPLGEITFSAGLASAAPGETLARLFARADRLLYAAKSDGRNCVKTG